MESVEHETTISTRYLVYVKAKKDKGYSSPVLEIQGLMSNIKLKVPKNILHAAKAFKEVGDMKVVVALGTLNLAPLALEELLDGGDN